MEPTFNLKPLEEHLSKVISPKQLARLLDELAHDYSRAVIQLQLIEDEISSYIHVDTNSFLHNLKELRDVLLKCED